MASRFALPVAWRTSRLLTCGLCERVHPVARVCVPGPAKGDAPMGEALLRHALFESRFRRPPVGGPTSLMARSKGRPTAVFAVQHAGCPAGRKVSRKPLFRQVFAT